jgi:hypothetical protein
MTSEQMAKCRGWIAAEESKGDEISLARALKCGALSTWNTIVRFGQRAELASHTNKTVRRKVPNAGQGDTPLTNHG